MGGDRPRNHIPARYVTVIDRVEGCVKYFFLDSKGCLVFEHGFPKLCKSVPLGMSNPPPMPEPQIEPMMSQSENPLAPEDNFGGGIAEFFGGENDQEFVAYEAWNPFLM
jgi:hypothetical protein